MRTLAPALLLLLLSVGLFRLVTATALLDRRHRAAHAAVITLFDAARDVNELLRARAGSDRTPGGIYRATTWREALRAEVARRAAEDPAPAWSLEEHEDHLVIELRDRRTGTVIGRLRVEDATVTGAALAAPPGAEAADRPADDGGGR